MVKGDNTRDHFQQLYQLELCMNEAGPTFRAARTISFLFLELMKFIVSSNLKGRGGALVMGRGGWGREGGGGEGEKEGGCGG